MKVAVLIFATVALIASVAHAGEPWFNDQGDCQRQWGDRFNGCVSRRDSDIQEVAGIGLRIAQAESARDAGVKPKQDAAELFARLDEKHHDRQDVFLPYLTRTVQLCRELRDLLVNAAAPTVANAKALVEMASVSAGRPALTPEVAAGLAGVTDDALALSMILDSTLPHGVAAASETKIVMNVNTSDVGAILDRLETSVDDIDRVHQELSSTLGRLTAENELMLESEKKNMTNLEATLSDAQVKKLQTQRAYDDALTLAQTLKTRKVALPGMIASEIDCIGTTANYRDSQCVNFWYHRNKVEPSDHGHGEGRF